MASSDEEGEILSEYVSDYDFVDLNEIPINFCVLPVKWHSEEEDSSSDCSSELSVFVRGNTDWGDDSFCKLVKAWKFDLSQDENPKIDVLLHGMHWITLDKPKMSYESLIRTTLVTLQFLHFVKRNPEASMSDVWSSLHNVDGVQPSEEDLSDHVSLLCEAMKRDEDLTKSKCLLTFLEKTSQTTPIEEELPMQYQEDAQIPIEEQLPMHYQEDAQILIEEELPMYHQEDSQTHNDEELPMYHQEDAQTHIEEELPMYHQEDSQTHIEVELPMHHQEDAQTHIEEEIPMYNQEDAQTHIEEELPMHHQEDAQIPIEEELPTHHQEDAQIPIEEELPTHHLEDAQTPMEKNLFDNMTDEEHSSDDDSEANLQFDPVCSICDNGGYVLCCEGSCLRSFHPTIADGAESACESLGFTDETHVHALGAYLCNNCLHKQHQCYACGQLGSSDENASQEVFPCSASNCGHFYHPKCVARLIYADDQIKSEELQTKIAARDSFACPLHTCKVCSLGENKNEYPLHFAVCRRCPKAYHRKCLPREITSELNCDEETFQRSWEKLLPYNRILIYCLDHEIESHILTPARDHIIFPDVSGQRRTRIHGLAQVKEDVPSRVTDDPKHHEADRKRERSFSVDDYLKKRKMADSSGILLSKAEVPSASVKPTRVDKEVDKDMDWVLGIIDSVNSSFNFDEFVKSRGAANHVKCYRTGNDVSRNITTGLVQTHVNAARAALKMFEEGDHRAARAIFDPDILLELMKHKRKLEIYLSPFLHGMRYTSFGRHFTKVEKLKEIVERLHWYVKNGDTVVDFCCGSNDFSCLMKEKLAKTGKSCFFKNFDLIQPKNKFNFEKRDWLTVKPEELPDGSQLIMGLNPPFGHKASLANTFIRKALEFKPKLLILIVPNETKRVDYIADYELIWEDSNLLSGMSFYLPGSLDANNKTIEQWNNIPPPLYLWSRKEWSRSHRIKALDQGHIIQMQHSTYNAITPQCNSKNGMVQDMDISPPLPRWHGPPPPPRYGPPPPPWFGPLPPPPRYGRPPPPPPRYY